MDPKNARAWGLGEPWSPSWGCPHMGGGSRGPRLGSVCQCPALLPLGPA